MTGVQPDTENTALNDSEAKHFLKKFGIAFPPERFVPQRKDVAAAADNLGYPVVLKGIGTQLMHKTDRGLVHLNLLDSQAVENAVRSIVTEASSDLDGFLIQPQVKGRRELVAGLFQDRQFGPVIMFGVGGVFTEAFADVVFRLAPLSEIDAAEMLEEIQGNALLGNFRGEKAVRRDELIQALLGLSHIGEAHPEISEIDINPLLVTPEGRVVAVDALVVTGGRSVETEFLPPIAPGAIGSLFYPKSVAIVGASA